MDKRIKITILGGSALATPKLFEAFGKNDARAAYDVVLLGHDREKLSCRPTLVPGYHLKLQESRRPGPHQHR